MRGGEAPHPKILAIMSIYKHYIYMYSAVDREIFTLQTILQIICVKNFRVVKFSRFRLIRKIFLTVDDYNVDEHLESSWNV